MNIDESAKLFAYSSKTKNNSFENFKKDLEINVCMLINDDVCVNQRLITY